MVELSQLVHHLDEAMAVRFVIHEQLPQRHYVLVWGLSHAVDVNLSERSVAVGLDEG